MSSIFSKIADKLIKKRRLAKEEKLVNMRLFEILPVKVQNAYYQLRIIALKNEASFNLTDLAVDVIRKTRIPKSELLHILTYNTTGFRPNLVDRLYDTAHDRRSAGKAKSLTLLDLLLVCLKNSNYKEHEPYRPNPYIVSQNYFNDSVFVAATKIVIGYLNTTSNSLTRDAKAHLQTTIDLDYDENELSLEFTVFAIKAIANQSENVRVNSKHLHEAIHWYNRKINYYMSL